MKKILALSGLLLLLGYAAFPQCSDPDAGTDIEVCGNICNLSVTNATTGYWTACTGDVPLVPAPVFSPSNTATEAEVTVTFTEPSIELNFVWTDNSGPCTDTAAVTFYRRPVANAGFDKAVCGNICELGAVYDLSGTGYLQLGMWSVYNAIPGASANISQLYNDTSDLVVSQPGIWNFVFRETNSLLTSCYDTDTVQIEFVEIPVVSAGEDFDVCGNCAILQGSSGGFSGTWLPNGAAFDDYTDTYTQVCVASYGAKTFVWLETNHSTTTSLGCSSQDDVVVTFWRIPTANILTDPNDTIACGLTFCDLHAEFPGDGITGRWWTENPATEGSIDSCFTAPSYGIHNVYWIEETGPELMPGFCTDTAGPLRLYFVEQPFVSAGADDYLYGYSYELNGEIMFAQNPYFDMEFNTIWQTDNAVLDNSAGLTTNATVAAFGEYEFRLLAYYTDFPSCFYRDTVNITYVDPVFIGIETENQEQTKFNIFPNPVSSGLNIVSTVEPEQIQITDINGRIIKTLSGNCKSIDISALEAGVYFIKIFLPDGIQVRKVVKE